MRTGKRLTAGALAALASSLAAAPLLHAEPLTPLTPGEIQYLDQARLIYAESHNPKAFRSDGEMLVDGHYACDKRAAGIVGLEATFVDPVLNQLAFIYLCP